MLDPVVAPNLSVGRDWEWPPGGTKTSVRVGEPRAHLRHMLRAPQLVYDLIQGVDWQLPAQHIHLG